jgi:hypothetical protein
MKPDGSLDQRVSGDEAVDHHVPEPSLDHAVAPQHGLPREPSLLQHALRRRVRHVDERLDALQPLHLAEHRGQRPLHGRRGYALAPVRARQHVPQLGAVRVTRRRDGHRADGAAVLAGEADGAGARRRG